jgi:aspartyl-tRNA(Asn)/glutamyl-tRNA(Gln) amidotransferase subunit C
MTTDNNLDRSRKINVLNKDELQKLLSLAHLDPDSEDISQIDKEINDIIGYISCLQNINTDKTTETAHIQDSINIMREDLIVESLKNKEIIKISPDSDAPYFRVPLVVES